MQSREPDTHHCCQIRSSARIPANRAAAHCHLVPQMEGEMSLSLYTPWSSCFFSGHSTGHIPISTNSKTQLPPELLERDTHREAPQHYDTDLYKDLGQTHRHQTALPVPPGTGGADHTSSKPGDQPDMERVQTASTGWGIRTLAGGSDLCHRGVTAPVLTGGLPAWVAQMVSDGLP